jgi:hypothetical protein
MWCAAFYAVGWLFEFFFFAVIGIETMRMGDDGVVLFAGMRGELGPTILYTDFKAELPATGRYFSGHNEKNAFPSDF